MTEEIKRTCKIHGLLTIEQLAKKRRVKMITGEEKIYYECKQCRNVRFKQWTMKKKDPDKVRRTQWKPIFKKSNKDMYSFMMDSLFKIHSKTSKQDGVKNV